MFDEVAEILARKVQKDLFIDPNTALYRKISVLVPWKIANVQVSHQPKAKRIRPGLEKCHRASVLLQNDDTILIEIEQTPLDAQAPRERFVRPVRYGIFILGYMHLVIRKIHHQHNLKLYNQLLKMATLSSTTCRRRWRTSVWHDKTMEQVNVGSKDHL